MRLAEQLGWHATQVRGDAQHTGLDAAPAPDARTAAVVMEHNYERDLALLRELLPSSAGYVGILGPRRRTEQLLADLRARDVFPTDAQVARLHGPVGLDIGAESAEEVALAIAAEVQAVFAGREGGQLRRRKGAIHE
jgi:xanthine/CO dehydrogenase XdhC/CoxF family maturation factor